jgi:hypothetical protein
VSGVLHDVAARYLTSALASARYRAPRGLEWRPDDSSTPAVDTFVAIGAISAEEASEWRARLARACEPAAEPDPDLRRRAIEHLERLDAAGGDVVTAVDALVAARAIKQDDAERWIAPRRLPIGGEPGDLDPPPRFDDSAFRRAVLGPETRESGVRVTVVELYDGGTVVNWHLSYAAGGRRGEKLWTRLVLDGFEDDPDIVADVDREALLIFDEPIALEDDLGTIYRAAEGGFEISERGRDASGYNGFATAVPPGATRLYVAVGGAGRITIPLER